MTRISDGETPPAATPPAAAGAGDNVQIPSILPAMLINDVIIFPNTIAPLVVSAEPIIKLVNDALAGSRMLAAFARVPQPVSDQPEAQFFQTGTAVQILKMFRVPDGTLRLLVQGLIRVNLKKVVETAPYLRVEVKPVPLDRRHTMKSEALGKRVIQDFTSLAETSQTIPEEVKIAVYNLNDVGALADIVASNLDISLEKKQEILESADVEARLGLVATHVARELKLVQLGSEIQTRVESEMAHGQREYYLREQMKAIRKELGEDSEGGIEAAELEKQINAAGMPKQALDGAIKELDRMKRMSTASAEYTVARTYIEWLIALPWQKRTVDELDVKKAEIVLNRDHYGLEEVKNRILEFLVVRKLRPTGKGPILCFAGPPGVGKTSLGKSIAVALNREFIRMSLGGMRDEAEIRGHRRTYVGAMPGRIIQSIRRVAVNNPVIMLDEIDKLGSDFRGDPASALLEVLDPAQNSSFQDHYLDVEFDLSHVFFITTANDISQIPGPLRDRMEIIEIPSYITSEKLQIAKHYLVPRQIEETGLKKSQIAFSDKGIQAVIEGYTREAGVRKLEQQISSVCRKVARAIVSGDQKGKVTITDVTLGKYLGPAQFLEDMVHRLPGVGVSLGLAWTPVGGDVLVIESTWMPGASKMQVTGQLGDVMKESAAIALSYLRANAERFKIDNDTLARHDIHIHVPEGATPKDGPSAGVTLTTSLASLFTNRPVKHNLAMTGEITLAGRVLPVGGIREKIVAANRHGIKTIIMPRLNEKDLFFVPDNVKKMMTFHFVDDIDEVLKLALQPVSPAGDDDGMIAAAHPRTWPLWDLFFPPLCAVCGGELDRQSLLFCTRCWAEAPLADLKDLHRLHHADLVRAGYRFAGDDVVRRAVHALKYEGMQRMAREMARRLVTRLPTRFVEAEITWVAVPLHWRRRMMRGFNQSELIACELAAFVHHAPPMPILKRRRHTPTQTARTYRERSANVRDAFVVPAGVSVPKRILLIDDVITTGATIDECARILKNHGAEWVDALSFALAHPG